MTAGGKKEKEPGWHKTAVYAVDGLKGSLTSDVFERRHVNRKRVFFIFNMPRRNQICIARCLHSYRDDLPKNLLKRQGSRAEKVHFRSTCVAQKRRCLNFLIWKAENVQNVATIVSHDDA